MYQRRTIRFDDYFTANAGEFTNLFVNDPAGALSLGLPITASFQTLPELQLLAVLSFTEAGSGTIIVNHGHAPDGTLQAGTWRTDADGRAYLENAQLNYPHHQSMVGVVSSDDEPTSDVSGIVRIRRNSDGLSGTLIDKPGFIRLEIVADQLQLTRWYNLAGGKKGAGGSATKSVTGPVFPENEEWHVVGFVLSGTTFRIIADGFVIAEHEVPYLPAMDPGDPLTIGPMTGDLDIIIYMGSGAALSLFNQTLPASGEWISPVIDLGAAYIFDSLTHSGYLSNDHRANLSMRLSTTADMSRVLVAELDLTQRATLPDYYPDRTLYPLQWAEGRYVQAVVSLSRNDRTSFNPHLSDIEAVFRRLI